MANEKYMQIPYFPTIFEKDKRFLDGNQVADLKTFIEQRYYKNKESMKIIVENITKAFIRNGSNIYSKFVGYPEWDEDKWIEQRRRRINILEQYRNQNEQSLFWTYVIDNKPYFKALHASEFIYSSDVNDNVEFVIIKTGEFLKQLTDTTSETWYIFKIWRDGSIYKVEAENWDKLPLDLSDSDLDEGQETYDVLPFTLIGNNKAKPTLSVLPEMESILSGGVAWGDISAQRAFLNQLLGVTNLSSSEWEDVIKQMGLFKVPDLKRSEDGDSNDMRSLDLGDGKTQIEWQNFIKESFKRLAYAEGVDINGLFSDIKVESGVARRLSMENIISVRDTKIGEWEEWEDRDQEVLISLGIVKSKSEVVYSPLELGETLLDKETTEKIRQENVLNRYKNGSITKVQYIQEMEGLNESEARQRFNEISKERIGEGVGKLGAPESGEEED